MSADAIHRFELELQFLSDHNKIRGEENEELSCTANILHIKMIQSMFFNLISILYSFLILISIVEWSTISPLNGHKSARTLLMK